MSRTGRPRRTNGTVYKHPRSKFWWVRYRSREGGIVRESTGATDRQVDSQVFKRYSHAKLNMMREALQQLDRQANERPGTFGTPKIN